MKKINFGRLRKLCDEISEHEEQLREAAQAEISSVFQEIISILKSNVPTVTALKWEYSEKEWDGISFEFDSDDEYHNRFYVEALVNDEYLDKDEGETLKQVATIFDDVNSVAELAFGPNVEVKVDIITGRLTTQRWDND